MVDPRRQELVRLLINRRLCEFRNRGVLAPVFLDPAPIITEVDRLPDDAVTFMLEKYSDPGRVW